MSNVSETNQDQRVCLINTPTLFKRPLSRSMAGGLGFDGSETMLLPPLDLAILASTLRSQGYDVSIIDADPLRLNDDQVISKVAQGQYGTVVATVSLPTIYNDCAFIKALRKLVPKVFAKTMIVDSSILETILQQSLADAVIFGECDLHIHQLISGTSSKGAAYIKAGQLEVEDCDPIKDLDQLPLPALDLLPLNQYVYPLLGKEVITMQTSRGCPFPCAYYCPYPLVEGTKWRKQSPERVYKELENAVQYFGVRKILFRDATFTLDKGRIHQICDHIIANGLDVVWWCETRVDCLDIPLLEKMKQAGCAGINIGVETGDAEVLKVQAKKGLTLEKLEQLRDAAKELGVRLHFLLSKGFPDETKKSFVDTYELMMKLRPESLGITIMTPYPGTQLYKEAQAKGWIESTNWEEFGGHQFVMHTDHLTREDFKTGFTFLQMADALLQKSHLEGRTAEIIKQEQALYSHLLIWAANLTALQKGLAPHKVKAQPKIRELSQIRNDQAKLSIIIPTYNRKDQLAICLEKLCQQEGPPQAYEVVVVDDGSTDGTDQLVRRFAAPYQLKYVQQENCGPGAARNRGVHESVAAIVGFIGDDIFVSPGFVAQHLAAHQAHPNENIAVLGKVDWPDEIEATPFMKYIMGPSGLQFNFTEIMDHSNVGHHRFYTSNITVKKSLLLKQNFIFDTDFIYAAMEDIELGYRLTKKGMRLIYQQEAMAYHSHPMDLPSFLSRQEKVGAMTVVYESKHPEVNTLASQLNGNQNLIVQNYCSQKEMLLNTISELEQFCFPKLDRLTINGTNGKDKFVKEILEPIYAALTHMALIYGYTNYTKPTMSSMIAAS